MEIGRPLSQTYCVWQNEGRGLQQYRDWRQSRGESLTSLANCSLKDVTQRRDRALCTGARDRSQCPLSEANGLACTYLFPASLLFSYRISQLWCGWIWSWINSFLAGRPFPVYCKMLNIISELFPLGTSNPALPLTLVVAVSLSPLPNVTWNIRRGEITPLHPQCSGGRKLRSRLSMQGRK